MLRRVQALVHVWGQHADGQPPPASLHCDVTRLQLPPATTAITAGHNRSCCFYATCHPRGEAVVIRKAVCIHEEDAGILWKHVSTGVYDSTRDAVR